MPQLSVTVPTPGTPVRVATQQTSAQYLLVIAAKGLGGPTANPNTGKVRVGFSSVGGNNPMELAPGAVQPYFVALGLMDLSTFYVDAVTANDGVVFQWI